jgi:hypothetical protein
MPDNDLTPAAAIRAFAFSSPATPAQAPPAAPAPTAPSPSVLVQPTAPITASQATSMAGWIKEELAKGKMTQAEAVKAFDDLGTPADQRVTPADTRTDEQRLIDEQFPVAKPDEFFIRYADPGRPAPPMSKELSQFDQSARAWLVGAEFPANLGNSLITNIEKVAQQTKAMTPDQLESYGLVEYEKLQRAYGDKLEEKLTSAGHMVEALEKKTPGLKNLLRSKGLGDSALIASMLIGQAERYWIRRKGR